MDTRNITLSLPRALLRRLKVVAAKRETSVSAMIAASLEDIVRSDDDYDSATDRLMARVHRGFDLGTGGRIHVVRADLHER